MEKNLQLEQFYARGQYLVTAVDAMLHGKEVPPLPPQITWQQMYETARAHSLEVMLLAGVESRVQNEPELLAEWRRHRDVDTVQTLTQISEQQRVLAAFSQAGVPILRVKGSALRELYPRPEYRQMSDIDLIAAPQDMDRAGALLKSLGYAPEQEERRQGNEVSYFLPPYMSIELHDNPVDRDDPRSAYFEQIWSKTEPEPGLPGVYHLRTEDEYLYLLAHFLKHYETAGIGIRQVMDLYLFRRAYGSRMDEAYLAQESKKLALEPVRTQVEQLAKHWFAPDPVPAGPAVEEMGRFCILSGIYGNQYSRRSNMMRKARQGGKTWRLQYIWRRLFPPMNEFVMRYPKVRSAPWLYPVYWLQRLFNPAYWKNNFRAEMSEMHSAERGK